MENGSSSAPFLVKAGAWLSTAAGNLYAAEGGVDLTGDRTIFKFAPDGTRTVFAGPDAFPEGEYPVGLAFDSRGNLFVSIETFTDPGADSIVYFTPTGVKSTFATGLTTPRGLAFDSSGNLFVAEVNQPELGPARRHLEVPSWRRHAYRFCLLWLRPPGIPHLRAPAITGLAHAPRCDFSQRGAKFK